MKYIIIIIIMLFTVPLISAQSKLVNNNSYKTWVKLGEIEHNISSIISNDGKYLAYKYFKGEKPYFQVKSLLGQYSKDFENGKDIFLTADSKFAVVVLKNDSVVILKLGGQEVQAINNISSCYVPKNDESHLLIYQLKSTNELNILNLITGSVKIIPRVKSYVYDKIGKYLVFQSDKKLKSFDLTTGMERIIVDCDGDYQIVFDSHSTRAALLLNKDSSNEVYFCLLTQDSATCLINNQSKDIGVGKIVTSSPISISHDGTAIFFNIEDAALDIHAPSVDLHSASLRIYNAGDAVFARDRISPVPREDLMVIEIKTKEVTNLKTGNFQVMQYDNNINRNNYLLSRPHVNWDDFYWNGEKAQLNLISTKNGDLTKLSETKYSLNTLNFLSPNERFVIWFDNRSKLYFSYEIKSKTTRVLFKQTKFPLYDAKADIIDRRSPYGVAGWIGKDDAVLIYDEFDIWKIDPAGKTPPLNLTKGIGRNKSIILRRVLNEDQHEVNETINTDTLLLSGVNLLNKQNGFWKLIANEKSFALEKCTMGDYVYYFHKTSDNVLIAPSMDRPQKARDANIYVVRRMSVNESPNLFKTCDFKTFVPITNIHPEAAYNWMKSTLVKWKLPNGAAAEGILYQPADFNPSKKYPVLIHYYEKLSNGLNYFPANSFDELTSGIEPTWGILNIPWYVSNGYIVFIPNVYYVTGDVSKSIVNSVLSGVKAISEKPWIDKKRMGLQGHSFGGYETLVLISNSKIFKAAQETSGYSNCITYYNHMLGGGGASRNSLFDNGQGNLQASMWENPAVFIKNSPIFKLNKVTTPLLILHNDEGNVPYQEAIQLFQTFRRLKKQAWMLTYDESSHGVYELINKIDFSRRQQEFFDYYLKDKAMPVWMAKTP